MQTFITSLDLEQSAYSLWENGVSGNRLQNQINEGLIILRTLTGWYAKRGRKGWPNHPATRMYIENEAYLVDYILAHIKVYEKLSGNDCTTRKDDLWDALTPNLYRQWHSKDYHTPHWLTKEFCSNHRAILLGKVLESYTVKFSDWTHNFDWPYNKLCKKVERSKSVLLWYHAHGWTEQPAIRDENGKWPYIWPVKE